MKIIKRIGIDDIFILLGMAGIGTGTYLLFGVPVSLVVMGALFLGIGLFMAGLGADRKK